MLRISHRGVALACEDFGRDHPPIILVHDWGCDRTSLRALAFELKARHHVVLYDLRGFGESDAPRPPYSLAALANDLAFVADTYELERPVVIGHGLGGNIALEAAAASPRRWSAVVMLESLVVPPHAAVDRNFPVLERLKTDSYRDVVRHITGCLAGPHMAAEDVEHLAAAMAACDQDVLVSCLEQMLAHDSIAAAQRTRCPLLYMTSGPWYTDIERFRALAPQLLTAQLVGCGHYFPMEIPQTVAQVIERFLETRRQSDPDAGARPRRVSGEVVLSLGGPTLVSAR